MLGVSSAIAHLFEIWDSVSNWTLWDTRYNLYRELPICIPSLRLQSYAAMIAISMVLELRSSSLQSKCELTNPSSS